MPSPPLPVPDSARMSLPRSCSSRNAWPSYRAPPLAAPVKAMFAVPTAPPAISLKKPSCVLGGSSDGTAGREPSGAPGGSPQIEQITEHRSVDSAARTCDTRIQGIVWHPLRHSASVEYEAVIGLEVHSQLLTESKMFCRCSADYANAEPNTHCLPDLYGLSRRAAGHQRAGD